MCVPTVAGLCGPAPDACPGNPESSHEDKLLRWQGQKIAALLAPSCSRSLSGQRRYECFHEQDEGDVERARAGGCGPIQWGSLREQGNPAARSKRWSSVLRGWKEPQGTNYKRTHLSGSRDMQERGPSEKNLLRGNKRAHERKNMLKLCQAQSSKPGYDGTMLSTDHTSLPTPQPWEDKKLS